MCTAVVRPVCCRAMTLYTLLPVLRGNLQSRALGPLRWDVTIDAIAHMACWSFTSCSHAWVHVY